MVRLLWWGPGRRWGSLVSVETRPRPSRETYWLLTPLPGRHPAAATLIGRVRPGPRSYWSAPRSAGGAARAGRLRSRARQAAAAARLDNERNSDQSSAAPRDCDTELLRVRKISVLCFSLQKRTTKIGQKKAGWQLSQSGLCGGRVNHQAGIIRNNRDCPPP